MLLLAGALLTPLAVAEDSEAAGAAETRSDLRAQVLLDRARFSPGEIDGVAGSNQAGALAAFQRARGLTASGELDEATWAELEKEPAPTLVEHVLTAADVAGPFVEIPESMQDKAKLDALAYGDVLEALGERFHAAPALLRELNSGVDFAAGATIRVPNVRGDEQLPKAAKVVVDESDGALMLYAEDDSLIAWFPATTGSEHDPLPIGDWKIRGVAHDPVFHYDPSLFHGAGPDEEKARIAPGPNNPVGSVWIDLSKEHYGIHGTPEPSAISKSESNGCIRLTNWDVRRVATAVAAGTAVVLQD
ncbi:L,D-transpeptidase family protein [Arenimonas composti]|uniref:L,D-transpeptidase family protein n=1 Tax=Arenimonas composti TaxID=370776 RepID=UPI003CCCDFEA